MGTVHEDGGEEEEGTKERSWRKEDTEEGAHVYEEMDKEKEGGGGVESGMVASEDSA